MTNIRLAQFATSGPGVIPAATQEKYEEKRMLAGSRIAAVIDAPSHSSAQVRDPTLNIPQAKHNRNEVRETHAWYTDPTVLVGVGVCAIAYFVGRRMGR